MWNRLTRSPSPVDVRCSATERNPSVSFSPRTKIEKGGTVLAVIFPVYLSGVFLAVARDKSVISLPWSFPPLVSSEILCPSFPGIFVGLVFRSCSRPLSGPETQITHLPLGKSVPGNSAAHSHTGCEEMAMQAVHCYQPLASVDAVVRNAAAASSSYSASSSSSAKFVARKSSCSRVRSSFWGASDGDSVSSSMFLAERRPAWRTAIRCKSPKVVAVAAMSGTPVRSTSVLVVGATGTLGRQIVRRALDEGYDIRCLVRSRATPADFLRDWGATVVNGDLSRPETLPAALIGIHTVIDCATGRPEEPIRKVDWDGKVALIQCAKAMGIQKFVFFSIHNCEKHPEVPLMEIKRCTEKYLAESGLNYTTIRLCGFMQGVIGQYAVPILEEKSVWGTDAPTRVAYMDTQDVARLTLTALRSPKTQRKSLTLAGPRAWTTQEVISLCERLAGQDAKVTTVPLGILKLTRILTRLFQWTTDVADRLAFSEVLTSDAVFSAPMTETYRLLGADPKDTTTLERYLQEYYLQILKKLKEMKATSKQGDYYL